MLNPDTLPDGPSAPAATVPARRHLLRRYAAASLGVTFVVAVLPVWLALWLFQDSFLLSLLVSFAASLALGRLGASIWQQIPASTELVFDDLLLWRFLGRLRSSGRAPTIAHRLQASLSGSSSSDKRLKLLKKLAVALENGDPYTGGHSQRVARHAYMTARMLRLPRKEARHIQLGALLHDVGKLDISTSILNKPGRLTDEEFDVIKTHPGEGAKLVSSLGDPVITGIVGSHHERIDGSGYPDRLLGTQIPIGARIVAVVDTFDAITSKRPYREARKHREAIQILEQEAGSQLDGDAVKAFLAYYSGKRSLQRWSFLSATLRHGPEMIRGLVGRAGMTGVANAMAAGGAALVFVGSGFLPAPDVAKAARSSEGVVASAKTGAVEAPAGTAHEEADAADDGLPRVRSKTGPSSDEVKDPVVDETASSETSDLDTASPAGENASDTGNNNGKSESTPVGPGNNNGKSESSPSNGNSDPDTKTNNGNSESTPVGSGNINP